jgi:hypothetical protein
MWNNEEYYGVSGGISEFNYLISTLKETSSEKQNNRTRADRVLKGILQEIA